MRSSHPTVGESGWYKPHIDFTMSHDVREDAGTIRVSCRADLTRVGAVLRSHFDAGNLGFAVEAAPKENNFFKRTEAASKQLPYQVKFSVPRWEVENVLTLTGYLVARRAFTIVLPEEDCEEAGVYDVEVGMVLAKTIYSVDFSAAGSANATIPFTINRHLRPDSPLKVSLDGPEAVIWLNHVAYDLLVSLPESDPTGQALKLTTQYVAFVEALAALKGNPDLSEMGWARWLREKLSQIQVAEQSGLEALLSDSAPASLTELADRLSLGAASSWLIDAVEREGSDA